jgi:hypothetical protein
MDKAHRESVLSLGSSVSVCCNTCGLPRGSEWTEDRQKDLLSLRDRRGEFGLEQNGINFALFLKP